MADYATTGLLLNCHPVALVRPTRAVRGIATAADLAGRNRGWISVAGLVLVRRRPWTAGGIVFMTLEDETGTANPVVRRAVYDRYRPTARNAQPLSADGRVERQGYRFHLLSFRLHDLGDLLAGHDVRSRDFH